MPDPAQRFEILSTIAAGDFATVLRARDRELGREVAIKQIHAQFLQDPKQLEKYWKEAQLLASLAHPHIITIYDIVREKGWLVFELMQGSLQQLLAGQPIDLNDLRMALTYTAQALQFIHQHNIVHGDVKPSNLLVGKDHRVKLGDFGIARRLGGDHGSVVKGTTKYMAPEVVSDQFGTVGPWSDLYSLGFSAYELLCGENFETLFPGLNMFGRDRQMAWLMWHSAPDRRLPEINRVLQGVPDDLAFIIQKLIEKDPKRRYRSADQLLEDLRQHATAETGPTPAEIEAAERAAKAARQKRTLTIGAALLSMGLSLGILFWPEKPPPAPPPPEARPTAGIVDEVDLENTTFFLKHEDESPAKGIIIQADKDRVFVNDERAKFSDLRANDQITIKYLSEAEGDDIIEVYASRPKEIHVSGRVAEVTKAAAELKLVDEEGQPPHEPWYVPSDTVVTINEQRALNNRTFGLADLAPEDRVVVSYVVEDGGRRVAKAIVALRTLKLEATVVSRNPQQNKLTVKATTGGAANREFTVARECVVTLNGKQQTGDVPLTIADLVPGDSLAFTYDVEVHAIVAAREVMAMGLIADLQTTERLFRITTDDAKESMQFALGANCEIIGPAGKPLEFEFLRKGDHVRVEYGPLEGGKLQALKLVVKPVTDARTWAILIVTHQFDDAQLAALPQGAGDLNAIRDALLHRHRVPTEQVLILENSSRLQIEQGVATFAARVPADAQLICYYEGRAVIDKTVGPVLATKELNLERAPDTGLPIRSLVALLEKSPPKEKTLLVDSCQEKSAGNTAADLSTAEQLEAAKTKPTRPVSTSVLVIGACDKNQRGLLTADGQQGVFGKALAAAYSGGADVNRDGRVAVAELLEFLPKSMAEVAGNGRVQSPVVYQPVDKPPRLTSDAQEATRKMLGYLRASRWDEGITEEFRREDSKLAGQPDLALAYGLVLLKNYRTPLARPVFDKIRSAHPKSVVADQMLAWQAFQQDRLVDGIGDLKLMVSHLPDLRLMPAAEPYVKYSLQWAGALREYVLSVPDSPLDRKAVEELDQAVIALGDTAKEAFRAGIESTRTTLAKLDEELLVAAPDRKTTLAQSRKRVATYANPNFNTIADYLRVAVEE
ncbi:MAG: serine/threonine-protein kinase [Planctomycetota bacterium]